MSKPKPAIRSWYRKLLQLFVSIIHGALGGNRPGSGVLKAGWLPLVELSAI